MQSFFYLISAFVICALAPISSAQTELRMGDRIVLFSPIAHENLNDPNLPDGKANNARIGAYTEATMAAAMEKGAGFVNLYSPTLKLYRRSKTPLTSNGIHPNADGCHEIARAIVRVLKGEEPKLGRSQIEPIREAVLDKNWHWFNRYRATDGNDIWGSRSKLDFTDGQTNRVVLEREQLQLDVMTANRDKVIWAAVAGKRTRAADSNVPSPIPVKTNLTNPSAKQRNKIGTADYLSPEESLATLNFADGLEGNVFASEEMFPDQLVNPVSDKIIIASKLLNHQDHQLLEFTAPSAPGNYGFVCTFPGHSKLMRGVMKVAR